MQIAHVLNREPCGGTVVYHLITQCPILQAGQEITGELIYSTLTPYTDNCA